MIGKLNIIEANMRKSRETTHSFFHDPDFEDASFLLLTEPYATLDAENHPLSVPLFHSTRWQAFYPSQIIHPKAEKTARTPFRSMILAAKGQKIQQVPIYHSDITALLLSHLERSILVVSVYIPCSTSSLQDEPQLVLRLDHIRKIYKEMQSTTPELELMVSGDFNRWDTLWGGNHLALHPRQGEGRAVIEFLSKLDLQLLLPRGTITYSDNSRGGSSTIDLIMTTSRLYSERLVCCTHETEHGSDHLAISLRFQIDSPEALVTPRRLYKNVDWKALSIYVQGSLPSIENINPWIHLDDFTSRLTKIVLESIELSVPIAKPSQYNKRWWTEDLSLLRKNYTHL